LNTKCTTDEKRSSGYSSSVGSKVVPVVCSCVCITPRCGIHSVLLPNTTYTECCFWGHKGYTLLTPNY